MLWICDTGIVGRASGERWRGARRGLVRCSVDFLRGSISFPRRKLPRLKLFTKVQVLGLCVCRLASVRCYHDRWKVDSLGIETT